MIAERRPGPSLAWPTDTVPGFAGPVPGRPVAQEAPRPEFGTVYQPVVDLASDVTVGYQAMVSVAGRWLPGSRPAPPVSTGADVAMEGALTRAAMSVAPVLPGHCWLAAEVSMRLLAADPVLVNGIGALARQVVLVLQQPAVADLDASLWWLLGRLPRNVSLAIGDVRPSRETMNILARLRPTSGSSGTPWSGWRTTAPGSGTSRPWWPTRRSTDPGSSRRASRPRRSGTSCAGSGCTAGCTPASKGGATPIMEVPARG